MRVDYITSPDFSRGIITVTKIIPKGNHRVKKVVGVYSIPILTEEKFKQTNLFDRFA